MFLARIEGQLVASAKTDHLVGRTMVLCRPLNDAGINHEEADEQVVAVDLIGAPQGSTVIVSTGSGARQAAGVEGSVDAAVVGLVDYLVIDGDRVESEG